GPAASGRPDRGADLQGRRRAGRNRLRRARAGRAQARLRGARAQRGGDRLVAPDEGPLRPPRHPQPAQGLSRAGARRPLPGRHAGLGQEAGQRPGSRGGCDLTIPLNPRGLVEAPDSLETERLLLRQFLESDVDRYSRMTADPEVMRYIGDGRTLSREETW